jgi:hypothetical protein
MIADVLSDLQSTGQEICHQLLGGLRRCADNHLNALLSEQGLGALSHASGEDYRRTSLRQPWWQHSGLVRRRRHILTLDDRAVCLVDVNKGEALAVTEVHRQPSFGQGYRDSHLLVLLGSASYLAG